MWLLLIAFGGGYYLATHPVGKGVGVGENPVSGQNAQPSQISPQTNFLFDPRVDNQNQPWYQGSQTAITDASGGVSNLSLKSSVPSDG